MAQSATPRSKRRLSEVARYLVMPSGIVSSGWAPVEARCAEWGDSFDAWQSGAGTLILGKRDSGEYAATVGGVTLSIPRQVAKTFLVMRIVFALCTLFPGLTVLWTAHRTRTATKTFGSFRGLASREGASKYVKNIRAVNGEQEIEFHNGSKIMFGAREQGFGRGFDEVDIEVFDEAQILTEKALEDMVAATNQSRFPAGALLFFMGTPPRPNDPGEAFKLRRREALAFGAEPFVPVVGEDSLYVECSADPDVGSKDGPDLDDVEQIKMANPSYPHRTPHRSVQRLRKNLPGDASWKREGLGVWDSDQQGSRLISEKDWNDSAVDVAPEGVKSFGVAFSFDGSRMSVAGGRKHADGVFGELVDAWRGKKSESEATVGMLADWLAERWRETSMIAISGAAGAPVLAQALLERGVPKKVVHVAQTQEYFAACALTHDGVLEAARQRRGESAEDDFEGSEGTVAAVTHSGIEGQSALAGSVAVCDKKQRGLAGAWGWQATTPDGDETPVEAFSLAVWAARTSKRVPGRKQVLI